VVRRMDTSPPAPDRFACRRTGRTYQPGEPLARTDRCTVYAVESDPALAVKWYNPGLLEDEPHLESRVQAMVAHPPAYRAPETGHVRCTWPEDLVSVDGRFTGYVMPRIDPVGAATLHDLVHGSEKERPSDGAGHRSLTWADRVLVAADLAHTVALLHDSDVVVGDLRSHDILVAPDCRVTLFGCDAMQVTDPATGTTYPCRTAEQTLVPPELLAASRWTTIRPRSSDLFSLAVELHLLLLGGDHPFDGEWRGPGARPPAGLLAQNGLWCHGGDERLRPRPGATPVDVLPNTLQRFFREAFVDGAGHPYDRPSAHAWQAELRRLHESLTRCARRPEHILPPVPAPASPRSQPRPSLSAAPRVRQVDGRTAAEAVPARGPATDPRVTTRRLPGPRRRAGALRLAAWAAVAALVIGGVGIASAIRNSAAAPGAPSVTASTATASAPPPPPSRPSGPAQALEQIHDHDARAAESLADAWVPQLATQPAAPSADDDATAAAILAGHRAVQRLFPDALLLRSAEWNYTGRSWITVLNRRFDTADDANAWCDAQRLRPQQCFAKRLAHGGAVDGTVKYRG
jgi:eukaryotic-like serine/threonine-protein kinase